ncbi:cytochrome c-type biogenesis protein CcmF [Povalibacter uvarum]|uniref:Cytochrome c-type biogenesis protein CcmF n=1 Tax=Povalibacter uvarum TaxID=732238 RepID=A0A841HJG2_9GAMM|nr:heme lyase CcmF/NrfE family subunit [Povalibacter uvarum]MBB6092165.1 cytochrome c-type biogenesis protein CcmF [Povalibacter uvarum]
MSVELGHFALILAFCLTLPQAFFGLAGAVYRKPHWIALTRNAVVGHFVLTAVSFACLMHAFYVNDFSVLYVAQNSNSELPTIYRLAATWGAHEGSLLLWLLAQATWTLAVSIFSRSIPDVVTSRVLGVLGLISAGFALFILTTSSPFERLWPAAVDGRDLNPLLQDPGLIIHPPMQYIGYIGMSVPFAFAVAAMLEGKLDSVWARWVRPWTNVAWVFLTCGITLGSWWAYYELGWGGWWFWDAVENASFMPWLVGTALIHSLAVTEKRGLFKSWTLLLSITAFSLSVLGTFLVRSGVVESVHAFASDPGRGLFILTFLGLCAGSALGLYAWRAPLFRTNTGFAPVSRESFLLINNVLLVGATLLILLGTLYPMFLDALNLGKISVGPPYFDIAFLIPMLPMVVLLAPGMHAGWKKADFGRTKGLLLVLLAVSVVAGIALALVAYGWHSVMTVIGFSLAFWVGLSALVDPVSRLRKGHSLSAGVIGMSVAHFGLAVFVLGVATTQSYRQEMDLSLRPGQTAELSGFQFTMTKLSDVKGPNYEATEAEIRITRDGKEIAVLHPQKRIYRVQKNPMTEAGIDSGLTRHLLVSMGEPLGDGSWSLRLQYKPMVRFIWMGAFTMALGGLIAAFDRRYRKRVTADDAVAAADVKTV